MSRMGLLTLAWLFIPHRSASRGQTIPIDPYDLIVPQYFNSSDKSGLITNDLVLYVVYNSGPLQVGALASYGGYHVGPEGQLLRPFLPPPPASATPSSACPCLGSGLGPISTGPCSKSTTMAGSSSIRSLPGCIGPTVCRAAPVDPHPPILNSFREQDTPSNGGTWWRQVC